MRATEHILVIKLSAFGDFVIALGAMRAIRAHHRDAHITLLTTAPYEKLARTTGLFDDVWIDPRPKWNKPARWLALRKRLNSIPFKRVYDLQRNDRTALYFKLFSPKPEWVGTAKGASHRDTTPKAANEHAFTTHARVLAVGGIDHSEIDTLEWMESDMARFQLPKPYVLIVPGAAPSRPLKKWPAEYYGALCVRLLAKGLHPVIIGSHHERDIAAIIKQHCPDAIDLTEKTSMTDLPALARGAAFCVGNDTGPLHMIGPTGCRCLVLFSSDSDPVRHRPLGSHIDTVFKPDLSDLKPEVVFACLVEKGIKGV